MIEVICAKCGKKFIPAPMHAYKSKCGGTGQNKLLCSYHCMLAWDKEHPPKRNYAKSKRVESQQKGKRYEKADS